MLLRQNLWVLAILLVAGQAFGDVTVYVDMRQTGPTNSTTGEIITQVGKGVNATYTATAGYNGQTTLNVEEEITNTVWSYTVDTDSGVVYSPQSGTGNSVTVTAKNTVAGTYSITVTFDITFTIKTPVKDSNGNYVYNNGVQQFTTRTDGPYTESGAAPLNVTNGQLKITLIPSDNFSPQRSYTTFGLGETGTINVESVPSGQQVTVTYTKSSDETVCIAEIGAFTIKRNPGSATITVKAKIGNSTVEEVETYGVAAIAPTGAYQKVESTNPLFPSNQVGASYLAETYLLPKYVSFKKLVVREGTTNAVATGSLASYNGLRHPVGKYVPIGNGNINDGCKKSESLDIISFYEDLPLDTAKGTFLWKIPQEYKNDDEQPVEFCILYQFVEMDGQKGCTISKGGASVTRGPVPPPNGNLQYTIH
jgi:hypothetical protein